MLWMLPMSKTIDRIAAKNKNQSAQLKRELEQWKRAYIDESDRVDSILGTLDSLGPSKPYKPGTAIAGRPKVSAVLCVNDWHTGLRVRPDEVQGYNGYSWAIQEQRVFQLIDDLKRWIALHRKAYDIQELVVLGLGDMIDGTIHLEQLMANEFAPPEQALRAGRLLATMLHNLTDLAPSVRCHCLTTDNHSRLTAKVMASGRGEWSWGAVVAGTAESMLRDSTVQFHNIKTIKMEVKINDRLFLCEHGNDVRGWMGLPHYGIERLKHREQARRAAAGKQPYDYFIMAHFHNLVVLEDSMICPALCGTTPYDHASARHAKPGQVAFLVGRHGWFNHLRIDL